MASIVQSLSSRDRKLLRTYRAIGIAFYHAVALLAVLPYFFTWTGVASAVLAYFLIGMLGLPVGYHRFLTHRGISCSKGWERVFATLGVLNVVFGPAYWVAIHRRHHHFADKEGDPHSPRHGFLKGYFFFLFPIDDDTDPLRVTHLYARDLLADPYYRWLEKYELWFGVNVASWPAFFLTGYAIGMAVGSSQSESVRVGWSVLVWGTFVRVVVYWHFANAVNSAAHLWGARRYETPDNSRNVGLLGILASGDGWHNNHHAFPRSARHGHTWWQLDLAWLAIRLLAALRIVAIDDPGPTAAVQLAYREATKAKPSG